jgi:hypothetical protein
MDNLETKSETKLRPKTRRRKHEKLRGTTPPETASTKWKSIDTPSKVENQSQTVVGTLEPLILPWASA